MTDFPMDAALVHNSVKTSLFISFCIFRDLPKQKNPRELCGEGDSTIFLCSHIQMEIFFDGTDQENSEKKRRKEWRKEKEEIFRYMEFSILVCSP